MEYVRWTFYACIRTPVGRIYHAFKNVRKCTCFILLGACLQSKSITDFLSFLSPPSLPLPNSLLYSSMDLLTLSRFLGNSDV